MNGKECTASFLFSRSVARTAAVLISSMFGRVGADGDRPRKTSSAFVRIAVRRLLKSCAMPPARTPRLSSFWAC